MKSLLPAKLFQRQLIALLGLALFVMASVGLFAFFRTKASMLARQESISYISGAQVERHLRDWLDERRADIKLLSQVLELEDRSLEPSYGRSRLRVFLSQKPDFIDAFVVDASGLVAATRLDGPVKRADLSDRDYIKAALDGKSYTSTYFRGRMKGNLVFALSEPLHDSRGDIIGATVGVFSLARLVDIVDKVSLEGLGVAILLDDEGKVISNPAFRASLKDQELAAEKALDTFAARKISAHESGSARYLNQDGVPVVGSFSWIDSLRLGLVIEFSEAVALSPVRALIGFLAFFAPLLLLLVAASFYISTRLVSPIGALLDATAELMAGHYSKPVGLKTGTEIDQLVELFDQMARTVLDREDQLRDNAARDSLTGLYNHGRVDEFLALELRRNRRSNGIVSFAMMDIDHFKNVNDNYGHLAGDEVLKGLARILEANVREGDLVGRFGGEEFAVILASSPPDVTRAFCERLRQLVEASVFHFESLELKVTVSIGWTSARACSAEAQDIIQRADTALYEAKDSGRNAVRGSFASSSGPRQA